MQGTSYTIKDFIDNEPHVEVWDENWDVIELFMLYSRQWRMAMNGPAALDFTVFFHELDRKGVGEAEYDRLVWQLKIVEEQALKWIHRK